MSVSDSMQTPPPGWVPPPPAQLQPLGQMGHIITPGAAALPPPPLSAVAGTVLATPPPTPHSTLHAAPPPPLSSPAVHHAGQVQSVASSTFPPPSPPLLSSAALGHATPPPPTLPQPTPPLPTPPTPPPQGLEITEQKVLDDTGRKQVTVKINDREYVITLGGTHDVNAKETQERIKALVRDLEALHSLYEGKEKLIKLSESEGLRKVHLTSKRTGAEDPKVKTFTITSNFINQLKQKLATEQYKLSDLPADTDPTEFANKLRRLQEKIALFERIPHVYTKPRPTPPRTE